MTWREYPELKLPTILDVSLGEFAAHSYEATSVRTIAKQVGVTVPALYYHFENKQAILTALLTHAMDIVIGHTEEAVAEAGDDPRARLSAAIEAIVLYMTNHRDLAFLDTEIRSLTEDNRRDYTARRDQLEGMVIEAVADGCASGEFQTPLPRESSRAIMSMCLGIATWFRSDGPHSADEVAAQYVQIALDCVRATPSAA